MTLQDKTIKCFSCDTMFTFSAEEQELFQSKGHVNEPKRCPSCRQARKERQGKAGAKDIYSPSRPMPQLHAATCTRCGKSTQVPFEPKANRPVYCRDCYSTMKTTR